MVSVSFHLFSFSPAGAIYNNAAYKLQHFTILFMQDYFLRYRAIGQMLAGAFMISFSAIFVKVAQVAPTCSAFYRVLFGFFFLLLLTSWRKELIRPQLRQFIFIAFCGLVFALDLFFWHESIMYIGPGLATLVSNFQVFFLAAVAVLFLKEKMRLRFLASLPIAVFGLFLIIGFDWRQLSSNYKLGLYLALLTAACYTVYLLSLKKVQLGGHRSPLFTLTGVSFFCALFLGLKMAAAGDSFIIPDGKSLLALLGLGLFCQTAGWLLITSALPRIQTSLAGLILLLQPSLSFLWDVMFFERPTSLVNWLGVAFTVTAIYMGMTGKVAGKTSAP